MKRATILLICIGLATACTPLGLTLLDSKEMPDDWQHRIEEGTLGKVDMSTGEMQNLDIPPEFYLSSGDEYTTGCIDYLKQRQKPLTVLTRFKVGIEGRVDSLTILSDAYSCRKSVLQTVETFRFLPGQQGERPLPSVMIYPLELIRNQE